MGPYPGLCITKVHPEKALEGLHSSPLGHEWSFDQHMTEGGLFGLVPSASALVTQSSAKVTIWCWASPTLGHLEWFICWTGEGRGGKEK